MSTTNLGNQEITFRYQHVATAAEFNTLLKGPIKPGIYSGSILNIIDNATVGINPFIACFDVEDDSNPGNKVVHVITSGIANVTVSETDTVVYAKYVWNYSKSNWWLDFGSHASESAVDNEIIFGTCVYSGSTLTSINYNNKTKGLTDELFNLLVPSGSKIYGGFDTDPELFANSDEYVASQKAIKTYKDTKYSKHILDWTESTSYDVNQLVMHESTVYVCVVSHVSSADFNTDFGLDYWVCINETYVKISEDLFTNDNFKKVQNSLNASIAGGTLFSESIISTYPLVYTISYAYYGGVLAPNGDIHFVPCYIGKGQKISKDGTVSTYALAYATSNAYQGGVLASNGDIHFIPNSATVGQKISRDGVVNTYSLVYTVKYAYNGGVLAPNGDIHFVPNTAKVGQKISKDGIVSTYPLVYTTSGHGGAYSGGVLALNGDIHFVPRGAECGQKISTLPFVPIDRSLCLSPFFNKL